MQQEILPIEVRGLIAKYGDRTILDQVDFTAKRGKITVILGPSGCGKSTLLRNILGLITPSAGLVNIFGENINELNENELKSLRARVGVLFQNGALFSSMTVGENVAMAIREHSTLPETLINQMVLMKLSLVGLSHAVTLYPSELSGGMRKRAGLARAIATDPDILFCDEPSAGLDPVTSSGLDDLLLHLKSIYNMTIVVVTHELPSIEKIADEVVMLYKGKVIAHGPLESVRRNPQKEVQDFFLRISNEAERERNSLLSFIGEARN